MSNIAVGIPFFKRVNKLDNLLNSVPDYIDTVYIADDGIKNNKPDSDYPDRLKLKNKSYSFDLVWKVLEYDSGLGSKRNCIVNWLKEDYILFVDSDHVISSNIIILREILKEKDNLGGISGMIFEPEKENLYITGQFFKESRNKLIRTPLNNSFPEYENINKCSIFYFDFISNACMFKKECLKKYNWDNNYVINKEHVDFYLNHYHNSDWKFAVCPNIIFEHYPGGNNDYINDRKNPNKLKHSESYLLDKWDYSKDIASGFKWIKNSPYDYYKLNNIEKMYMILRTAGLTELIRKIKEEFKYYR